MAFDKVAKRYLEDGAAWSHGLDEPLILDERMFIDECRIHHKELSDDQIRTIYALSRDEWAHRVEHNYRDNAHPNIFNVLIRFAEVVMRDNRGEPLVRFNHLFRWREVTLGIGEDIVTCAFLANERRNEEEMLGSGLDMIDFCKWPTILHNDNPHLKFIFEKFRLHELHSHLRASTDIFALSWVSLMNDVRSRESNFRKVALSQDPSRCDIVSKQLHSRILAAASIRLFLWRYLKRGTAESESFPTGETYDSDIFAETLSEEIGIERDNADSLDYIDYDVSSPLGVISGERRFLFCMFERILRGADRRISELFYRYLLIKSLLRSFLVQVNANKGFANFKRFQDLKSVFLTKRYKDYLYSLPVWEATVFNYTDEMETRITPIKGSRELRKIEKSITKYEREQDEALEQALEQDDTFRQDEALWKWSLIFHFIKNPYPVEPNGSVRGGKLRESVRQKSFRLDRLFKNERWRMEYKDCRSHLVGIDAASSEIGCRPEIFAQAFRFLKASGYSATFHAGEDFYDLCDGLRSIDESIRFLGLEAGDRIGHALALGINAVKFYRDRHYYIGCPRQWMLDNIVWLYYKSREWNIILDPETETFLTSTFRKLIRWLGYSDSTGMLDYYHAMLLRGDAPIVYLDLEYRDEMTQYGKWYKHSCVTDEILDEIRENKKVLEIHNSYLLDERINREGRKMGAFKLPKGYAEAIESIQDKLTAEISKRQIGIECCPSSNYKIGYFEKYEDHPIFRFMPVRESKSRYPLAVTVNTDDLGVFATSLPNEFSLLALALLKQKDVHGGHVYSTQEVYDWVIRVVENGKKFAFQSPFSLRFQ